MTSNLKMAKRNVLSKKIKLKGVTVIDRVVVGRETTTILLLLRLPRKGGKATESKPKWPAGTNIMLVKSFGSTVTVRMTSNLKTVKRNVLSKKIKLKGVVMIETLDVTDLQETKTTSVLLLLLLPRRGGKATE